jgi:hypothetical protein
VTDHVKRAGIIDERARAAAAHPPGSGAGTHPQPPRGCRAPPRAPGAATASSDAPHITERPGIKSSTTKDGVEIFYKDRGKGTPIVFSYGWPLSSDDWDQ